MMNSIKLMARAKINWTLDITGLTPDGYHVLDTLMQRVSLFDTVTVKKAAENISVSSGHHLIADDNRNIAYKAASLFFSYTGIKGGCEISIAKHIPVCAGMGGGSADGAAVLFGLNKLYRTHISTDEMDFLALKVGADVPFMLKDGLYRAKGVGEKLEKIICEKQYHLLGLMPPMGASTKEIFKLYDQREKTCVPNNYKIIRALQEENYQGIASNMGNVLQPVTQELIPEIDTLCNQLKEAGALAASMTGSGSLVFGLFATLEEAQKATAQFNQGYWYRVFSTCNKGISVIRVD